MSIYNARLIPQEMYHRKKVLGEASVCIALVKETDKTVPHNRQACL